MWDGRKEAPSEEWPTVRRSGRSRSPSPGPAGPDRLRPRRLRWSWSRPVRFVVQRTKHQRTNFRGLQEEGGAVTQFAVFRTRRTGLDVWEFQELEGPGSGRSRIWVTGLMLRPHLAPSKKNCYIFLSTITIKLPDVRHIKPERRRRGKTSFMMPLNSLVTPKSTLDQDLDPGGGGGGDQQLLQTIHEPVSS